MLSDEPNFLFNFNSSVLYAYMYMYYNQMQSYTLIYFDMLTIGFFFSKIV